MEKMYSQELQNRMKEFFKAQTMSKEAIMTWIDTRQTIQQSLQSYLQFNFGQRINAEALNPEEREPFQKNLNISPIDFEFNWLKEIVGLGLNVTGPRLVIRLNERWEIVFEQYLPCVREFQSNQERYTIVQENESISLLKVEAEPIVLSIVPVKEFHHDLLIEVLGKFAENVLESVKPGTMNVAIPISVM